MIRVVLALLAAANFSSVWAYDEVVDLGIFSTAALANSAIKAACNRGTSSPSKQIFSDWQSAGCIGIPKASDVPDPNSNVLYFYGAQNSSRLCCSQWVGVAPCGEGEVRDADGQCKPMCEEGDSSTADYWRGDFSISTEPGNTVGNASTPSSLCDGQCRGSVVEVISCESDADASPGNPAPVSCTASIQLTGEQCTDGKGSAPVYTGSGGGGDPDPGTNPGSGGGNPDSGDPGSGGSGGDGGSTGGAGGDGGGTGSGSGSGDGSGSGGGDCDPQTEFCGPPTGNDLYTPRGRTFSDVLSDFHGQFVQLPIVDTVVDLLTIHDRAGSCPSWRVDVEYLNASYDIGQYFCMPEVLAALTMAGIALLFVVTFLAFQWAFL